ncbi:hypothetical protein [Microbacterium gubbeenense]|uniref:hypothetical protein n=1 Tax=Microbacterium gubbeenense TaxID=159896 RepID=UPI003F94845D
MSTTTPRTAPLDPLEIGVRRIRRVGTPEAPFTATRAVMAGEEPVLLVDVDDLDDWPGWQAAGAQHLLGPTDVLRGQAGHEAILSDLREPCARTFGARDEAGAGWLRGEAVTCIVSMLRGVSEAAERGLDDAARTGDWWITADGRPVFAFVCGDAEGRTVAEATGDALRRIQLACDDRVIARIVDDALDALEGPSPLARRAEEIEMALFEAAAPQPIAASAAHRAAARPARSIDVGHDAEGTFVDRIRALIERHVDTGVGDAVAGALRSMSEWRARRGTREKSAHHGRVALIGLGAAAVVLAGGMLWPVESAPPSQAASPSATATPTPTPTPTSLPGEAVQDPIEAATEILVEWGACPADCDLARGLERSGAVAAPEPAIALVDDYGEVVLLKVTAPEENAQLMVLERADEKWRIRDVFDAP